MFFLCMHKERTKENTPRSITLPSASARCTSHPATASAKVRALRGQPPLKPGANYNESLKDSETTFIKNKELKTVISLFI